MENLLSDVRYESVKFDGGVEEMKKKNKALVKAMVDAEMTQAKLAVVCEMHLTNINSIVNGTRPRVDTALKIARALNTSVEALWGTKEDDE